MHTESRSTTPQNIALKLTSYKAGIFKAATLFLSVAILGIALGTTSSAQAQTSGTVLTAAEATKLLPASVFFRGQSATTQLRNSGGVKFSDGFFVLSTMVDTSGYATDVQQKYQAYFITEVPIKIEGHSLAAGIYGIGFLAGNKFVVLDVGAHELFSVSSHADAEIKRPTPLKVTAEGSIYRLYAGRNYVTFAR
jgi:molecular chaperone DnaK (HSP70)